MDRPLVELLFTLIRNIAVVMILAYLLARIPAFADVLDRRPRGKSRLLFAIAFGFLSIYGTASGIELFGALVNFRDLGPAAAGLLAGPLTGMAAGLIGGIYRYSLGGLTALPCAIAPVLAGALGGLLFLRRRERPIGVGEAVLVMVAAELLHGAVTLLLLGPREEVLEIVRTALPPMILANAAGMAVFIFMLNNLVHERLTEAAKHRLDSELKIAREIQMSMLPREGEGRFDLHALMRPAREVGGDLYNFFPVAAGRLCLVIGDVAGKGVPASLYMAITQKLIRAAAREGGGPAEILTRVNRELCDGNDTVTFVTLFMAFFDPGSGEVLMGNAGHNPPCLVRPEGAQFLTLAPGIALGVKEDFVYAEQALRLAPGESLLLYTDGVTEAMDARENLYSDGRLLATLKGAATLPPAALCEAVLRDLARFVGPNEQSDDITLMALRCGEPQ